MAEHTPPTNADTGSVNTPSRSPKRVITSTAPADAPEDNPNKKGSARSLRVVVCNNAPTIASPAPVSTESNILGTRKSVTILLTMADTGSSTSFSAPSTYISDSETVPLVILNNINPISTTMAPHIAQ